MASRKRKRHEEHENHERWLVSYADFITLLFAFFAVLYATSQADTDKQEQFEKSIQREFKAGYFGFGGSPKFDEFNDSSANSLIKPPIEVFPPVGAGPREVRDFIERRLEKDLPESERSKTITGIRHDAVGVQIQLAASRLFESGSAELSTDSVLALDRVGQLLKESGRKIVIEGHTDDEPVRTEKFPSNWELAAARATKIVRYLVARHKISPSQLVPVAYADQKPIAANDSPENRALNRRIEIKIVTSDSSSY